MSKLQKRFSKEEKLQIVNQSIDESMSNEDLGLRYGVHPNTISRWRRELGSYEHNAFPGKGILKLTDDQRTIQQLEKELREERLKNEILKKAVSIISSPDRKNLLS
ncbi:MAG: transposase [Saprospiraceae bacterium]